MGAALASSRQDNSAASGVRSPSRGELLERYRQLRVIGRRQHSEMLKFASGDAMLKQARRLGLAEGKTLMLDSIDDMNFVFDLLFYTSSIDRPRVVDRYARLRQHEPGSDEAKLLAAKQQARFAIIQCQQRHPIVGLIVRDLVRNSEHQLIDEGLEVSLPPGAMIATRLIAFDDFDMTAGVMVPVEAGFLKSVFNSIPNLQRKPAKVLINDRRLAEAIYRAAVSEGVTDRIAYRDPGEDPLELISQKALAAA